jgi:uncharacterized protein YuzE
MKTTYDKITDATYLYVSDNKIAKTVPVSDRLIVDLDKDGLLVGIEMLGASTIPSLKEIEVLLKEKTLIA